MTLYEYRIKKGLSQEKIAKLVGCTQGAVSKFEARGVVLKKIPGGYNLVEAQDHIIATFKTGKGNE